ncbi:coagulation factor 5/8 type domain-containing protein [Streptomyces sp. 3MP-14]|uniref:Coagulation factor 5/8 type domain-containing protein n=1 Tax=Streptomyces mimosae TaxID=2586635 RepID=A0A5N6ACC1_9ACTN|nr:MULTISPECIES: coagulation factor 5/8 type domain-containing protein [Streptomyces]KAB8166464.1 coagulation factor 5/8 type domain-containing protein [Streptomyces mimosae]KAB8178893.1 coagulation factor 5/8 type domain-containing protein [Streptomyces sp. 3MP-14]
MPDTPRPPQRPDDPTEPPAHGRRLSRRTLLTGIAVATGAAGVGVAATTAAGAGPAARPPAGTSLRPLADPDLGPNVHIFGPETPSADIQAVLDGIFDAMETDQFGTGRHAVLFKPGSYAVNANVGYYTQIAGLGLSPDDVAIDGTVHVEADWFDGNATHNFWRCAENLSVSPPDGFDRWAVSQAAPYRRMHVNGDLVLDDGGWSSGGFMADCRVEGDVNSGSQQQWLSRDSEFGSWTGANWNMVFVGVENAPAGQFPEPPYTVVDSTPLIREKPFLHVDDAGAWHVFVPALRTDTSGTTWHQATPEGESIPVEQFLVADPDTPVPEINAALAEGRHLLLTPGIYWLDAPIEVGHADTVVLGLGLATLVPAPGQPAVTVADVDGVKVAGILIDANEQNSPLMMLVGEEGADADHSANPTSLHDVFFRIGGMHAGNADVSLAINSNHVICDHTWLWRGDHGTGIGWNTNPALYGLIVNGDDVTAYGLFVEHYQDYQVFWNGERGRTYFYQSEMPYDPPNQESWMNGSTRGFASYKVNDAVTDHRAWGLGVYCFFNANPSVVSERGIEVPQAPGVALEHLLAVSLGGGTGTIEHVVNDTGGPAGPGSVESYVVSYP